MDVQVPPPPPPPPSFLTESITSQLTVPPPAPPLPPPETVLTTQPTTTNTSVAASTGQDRIWLHPWTVTEMRQQASQWSLAGDAGLLLYLEQFSDKLVQRADAIQQHLNQTVNAVKSTHTRVQNCLNEFTSLANTQFIENRVYDEDETVNAKTSKKDEQSTEKTYVSNSEAQEKVLQRYVEAIQSGLSILDTHFERVEAKLDNIQHGASSVVDDDDEDVGVPIEPILEPKDPYIFRPLPYLIGTTEFMQDDFVGLGDLLTIHDEEIYDVEQIEKIESDSALSSSDEEDEDFQAQVTTVQIVPAGASRPDIANRPAPSMTTTQLTDSEDEDDPFGMNTGPKFDDFSSKKLANNDLSEEPIISTKPKKDEFSQESDNEEDSMFGIQVKKPQIVIENNNENNDNESLTSKESNEPDEQKHVRGVSIFGGAQKGMSELEKAVLRRRKAMGEPDVPSDNEDEEVRKPTRTSKETTSSSIVTKTTTKPSSEEPSSSTISNLTSQPLTRTVTTTDKTSKPSIFGETAPVDDDDDEIFMDAPKLKPLSNIAPPSKTIVDTKPSIIISSKKEKDIFDNDTDEDDDPFAIKKKDTSSSLPIKKNEINSKTQSQIIAKPKPVIQHDESDDDEIFGTKKTQPKPIPTVSKPSTIEKTKSPSSDDDLFNTLTTTKSQPPPATTTTTKTSNDEDTVFARKAPVQQPTTSIIPPPASVSIPSVKKPTVLTDEDSDDEIFGISKTKPKVQTTEISNIVSPPKPNDNNNVLDKSTIKLKVSTTDTPKVTPSSIKSNNDNDDDLFSISTTKSDIPKTEIQKISSPTKTDDEDDLFGKPTIKSKVLTTDNQKVISPMKSNDNDKLLSTPTTKPKITVTTKKHDDDDDDDLFSLSKPIQIKAPETAISSPLPSTTAVKTETYEDPLSGIRKPIETTSQQPIKIPTIQPVKTSISDTDEDELFPKRQINTAALKEGEKPNVKALSSLLNINPNAHRPGTRPKTHSITEEQSKPSVVNDDQPIQNIEPSQNVVKKLTKLDSDSDDDLFSTKKKEKSTVLKTEQKDKTNIEDEKVNVKALSSRIKINPMMHMPGTHVKPDSNEDNESNNVTQTISIETSKEESLADKTMLNILKDRAKVSVKTRAPPTRKPRSTGAATAATTNDDDDLFALPSSTKTATSSSPTISPVILPQSDISPPVPVTGLPDNTAAIAAISNKQTNSKEKKTFSLFDSDDSDIDELLFGFSKKNKPSTTSKPTIASSTTSKPTTKAAILSLDDDDDDDFLSKRPTKKSTKPIDDDDIFADVKIKSQQTNKAKKDWSIMNKTVTDNTDDIFNDASTKSSATSKAKTTNVKNKSIKDLDDIFDDPLNISSKK
ncbi:unnamed protein product [Rotaria sp. Silwood1]|nr:unnamed protein product [Rotaria sp. Silwood1]